VSPSKLQSLLQQAIELHRSGQLAAAEKVYAQVRAAAPKNFDALHLSGFLAYQQNRIPAAIELLERALRVDRRSVDCELRLGLALLAATRLAEAEQHMRQALERSPGYAEGWDSLSFCLRMQDRLPEALACSERAVQLNPRLANNWYNLGGTHSLLGEPAKALPCHERALALDPNFVPARLGLAQALHLLNRIPEAVAAYGRVLEIAPALLEARTCRLLALHNLDTVTAEQLFAEHVAYGRVLGPPPPVTLPNRPDPSRRLRLGILSPDLREHSCAYFLEPLLQHLDRTQFEIYLYHDHFRTDPISARLQALGACWRNFNGQPHNLVEATIRADAPDILIDLAGHTGTNNRLPVFARRLAPVQVTYLGYPNTTGVAAMDYRFTDGVADPVGRADGLATERLVRFAPTAWAYAPAADGPEPVARPAGAPVAFGCFNTPSKLTDPMLEVWGRLLQQVPGSRLVLKGSGLDRADVRESYLERLARAGIPGGVVTLLPRTATTAEHLTCYGEVDIALDTFPYHGTTTTCEALWMGVPVVSLAGDRHVSRVGASLLSAVGHREWVASNADEYIAIAARLAADAAGRTALRTGLRAELRRSALLDHAGQAARFGAALRECWAAWCARQQNAA
jgi:predicted O-linked N-acetylglucosamine transferase (SPINDLY family)